MPRRKTKTDLPFWWRKGEDCYYVQRDGKKVRLSPDLKESWRLYHELMAREPEEPEPVRVASSELLVSEACDRFMDWAEANKERPTYQAYHRRIGHFLASLDRHGELNLPVSELKPFHVTRSLLEKGDEWTSTSKNDIVSAVQRAFNWAASGHRRGEPPDRDGEAAPRGPGDGDLPRRIRGDPSRRSRSRTSGTSCGSPGNPASALRRSSRSRPGSSSSTSTGSSSR